MISSKLPQFTGDVDSFLTSLERASGISILHSGALTEGADKPGLFSPVAPDWLRFANAPIGDLFPTQIAYRAALLGLKEGKSFYHHELRRRLRMPPELEPSIAVWEHGTVPVWENGILNEPKYFSFFQEAPLASFNPNHQDKWRAHELLHGAVSFFWRPDLTRFEAYLCARLNELIPVVEWWYLDEIFRHRCPRHRNVAATPPTRHSVNRQAIKEWCSQCEAEQRPYWEVEITEEMRQMAKYLVENAVEHFEEEFAVCREEMERCSPIETPRGVVNGSSDAYGYMEAHWNRMTAWSFGSWVERYLVAGVDYVDTLEALFQRVDRTWRSLLGGDIELQASEFMRKRRRRIAQDIAYRCYLALEWLDPDLATTSSAESLLAPLMEACDHIVTSTGESGEDEDSWEAASEFSLEGDDSFWSLFQDVSRGMSRYFPKEICEAFPSLGIIEQPVPHETHLYIMEGLSTAFPGLFSVTKELPVERFCEETMLEKGQLADRFSQYLQRHTLLNDYQREVARFEAWALDWPHHDREAERFGALPDDFSELQGGLLRLNQTVRRESFLPDVLMRLLGIFDAESIYAYYWQGELRILEEKEGVGETIQTIMESPNSLDSEGIQRLFSWLDEGFFIYIPPIHK